MREQSDLPIIMVTARTEEIDRVLGLNMGADDYLCKPFSPKELVARVQAVLRRLDRKSEPESNDLFRMDKSQQRIWYQQKALNLTPTEFRLLELFLEHVGQVYSRAQLLDHINPDSFDVADRVIDSHINISRICAVKFRMLLKPATVMSGFRRSMVLAIVLNILKTESKAMKKANPEGFAFLYFENNFGYTNS